MKTKSTMLYTIVMTILCILIICHIFIGPKYYDEHKYHIYDWYEESDSITLSFTDIYDWELADDSPVIICKYQDKDLALSCVAFQYLCYHDSCTLFKDNYHGYVTIDELE